MEARERGTAWQGLGPRRCQPFGRRDRHRLFEVGALIESAAFYPFLSGRQNLRELAATGAPIAPGRIEELLDLTGLRDRAGDKVSTYSLGMKQRLGIAAALLSDPTLLLLDEPANGLVPAGMVAIRETLRHSSARRHWLVWPSAWPSTTASRRRRSGYRARLLR